MQKISSKGEGIFNVTPRGSLALHPVKMVPKEIKSS